MALLHPIFLIPFFLLIYLLFKDDKFENNDSKNLLKFIGFILIIAAGGRYFVGADYPIYKSMYEEGFPLYTTYADVWNKATFQENSMEIEWAYVLVNKIFFDLGLPYYAVTFFVTISCFLIIYRVTHKYSYFPALSYFYYFMPTYFIAECGQMRQALGGMITLLAIQFIFERKLLKFLLIIFIALGFHKSTIIFIPAYWIILLPFNAKKWLIFLVASVLLAPFEIYNYFGGAVESFMPQDVSNAYTGYSNDTYYGNDMKTGFADVINWFFIIILIIFDKVGERKVYYYEYFRNLAFFGFCMFYIFRGNEIFATRLPAVYFVMAGFFMIPSVIQVLEDRYKNLMKLIFLFYFLGFFVLFSMGNAKRGSFTWDRYKNILWSQTK